MRRMDAAARHWRINGQGGGQTGLIVDPGEGYNRLVEDDNNWRTGRDFLAAVAGLGVGDEERRRADQFNRQLPGQAVSTRRDKLGAKGEAVAGIGQKHFFRREGDGRTIHGDDTGHGWLNGQAIRGGRGQLAVKDKGNRLAPPGCAVGWLVGEQQKGQRRDDLRHGWGNGCNFRLGCGWSGSLRRGRLGGSRGGRVGEGRRGGA